VFAALFTPEDLLLNIYACYSLVGNAMPKQPRIFITAMAAAMASLAGCGGGGGGNADSVVFNILNTPACTTASGGSGVPPTALVLGFFATIYQLETGTIDEFGAFIQTSSLIFKLAVDGVATVDGNNTSVSNTCYQISSNKLSLTLGDANSAAIGNLELLSGGRASGTINGKTVRTKTN
jgi:hypothetical protein